MPSKTIVAVLVAAAVLAGTGVPYGGGTSVARAQDGKTTGEHGVKAKDLVTSLGGFKGTASIPVALSGKVVEIEPGGQTGREQFLVPSYVYVLEGTLTTNTEGGPTGVAGAQYHAAGQSYMDPPGVWHTHSNGGTAPVKYLLLLISTPGGPLVQKAGVND
jgi:quercetin dioxygenase-like cupin family protein